MSPVDAFLVGYSVALIIGVLVLVFAIARRRR